MLKPDAQPRDELHLVIAGAGGARQLSRFTEASQPRYADIRGELAPDLIA